MRFNIILKTMQGKPIDPGRTKPSDDLRCDCGALLARTVEDRLELKCRRCRRIVVLKLDELSSRKWVPVQGVCR